MTDPQNPYEAPSSDLVVDQDFVDGSLRDIPRKLAAGRGLAWIGEAWGYFKQSPLNWILMFLILVAMMFMAFVLPTIVCEMQTFHKMFYPREGQRLANDGWLR